MDHVEITFARTSRYSVDLSDPNDRKSLAKALDMRRNQLDKLIENGELLDDPDRWDTVVRWLDEPPIIHSITDEEGIEDLEVHTG